MTTKYPIILVHGIIIKDIGFIKSFGRIDTRLKKLGFKVYKSKVESFATIEHNATILKKEVEKIMRDCRVNKVNVIAHSKGGLDAKYMIEHFNMYDNIASFTTLCTPHRGSAIATRILKNPRWLLRFTAFWINLWYRILGDKKPDCLKVCEQLASSNSVEEETFKLRNSIYCQSYSTTLKHSRDDFIMGIPLIFSHHLEKDKESDGVVNQESSQFCLYKGDAFADSVSHSEIVDFMVAKKKREKIYGFYQMICEDLARRGF